MQDVEDRMDKRMLAIERDLKIKGKKLAVLMRDMTGEGSNQNSKKSLHDGKNSVDMTSQYSNALYPKLPFMK